MTAAFERAIEISHYVGKLWDIATNPDISQGKTPADYNKILVTKYGRSEKDGAILSGNVPGILKACFEGIAQVGVEDSDDLTRGSLKNSLSTLERIAALPDPAEGHTTHFSNLQQPLLTEMQSIKVIASNILKLEHA